MSMRMKNVEDIYPLSPMQQGMLFHTLYAPRSGVYHNQLSCLLHGDLDIPAFERAWQRVIDRHPGLRAAFLWEKLDKPLQIVRQRVQLPLTQEDWRALSGTEQDAALETYLQTDSARGFALTRAPLMRLALLRLANDHFLLVWSFHHLLLDGWSVPVVLKEVFALYESFHLGRDLHLPPVRPYRDYIAWFQQQDLAQAEAFWRRGLEGFTASTPLGVDKEPGEYPEQEELYEEQALWMAADTTTALQTLVSQWQVTLNTLMQGIWTLLLSRYSGEQDVLFGASVSGRPSEMTGVDSMVGLFMNTLPVRVYVAPEMPLRAWLRQLQVWQIEAREYEYSPLVQVQGWSGVSHGLPLFESLLSFENYPMQMPSHKWGGGLEIRRLRVSARESYPLNINIVPGTQMLLRIGYDRQRFEPATITRMLGHLQVLLEGVIARPGGCLADLPILTQAERRQVLQEWNARRRTSLPDGCIHTLFTAQAECVPDAVALVCRAEQLTYSELNARANQLAHYLQAQGIGPEALVGILLDRSVEMLVGMLGVFKAGGAYVPLDPASPAERLVACLQDAHISVLLTRRLLYKKLLEDRYVWDGLALFLDADQAILARESRQNPESVVIATNLAYVIYTSGSTGIPKGAMIEQRGMINHLYAKITDLRLTAQERVAQTASHCFDISVWQFLAALLVGGRVVIFPDDVAHNPLQLLAQVEQEEVSILETVPSLLRIILEELEVRNLVLPTLAHLRWLIPTGEALPPELCQRWLRLYPRVPLLNAYGPTECSDDVTHYVITHPLPTGILRTPLGQPVDNLRLYVLDQRLEPVPLGVSGELYVGGVGVGRGYLSDGRRTAEVFIPDPFSAEVGGRLYKTGDLARYLPDSNIEYLGRNDEQVKIRGHRIELGEVEAMLATHPSVRACVVAVFGETEADRRLAAYVVLSSIQGPAPGELRQYLQTKLPDAMVPALFMMLDALPLMASGKVDRRALPVPASTSLEPGQTSTAPRTAIEEVLAGIWARLLKLPRVGIHDNFFEQGGHSLLVTQVVSRVRDALQVELPLRSLFEAPTVARLAERIAENLQRDRAGLQAPIECRTREGVGHGHTHSPLSFAQERLWILDQLEPGSPLYNISTALRLLGSLNSAALERSFTALVQRHEILRTRFVELEGGPVQMIASLEDLSLRSFSEGMLKIVDLETVPAGEAREAEIERHVREEVRHPFNLACGQLMRAILLRLGTTEHLLLLSMHHIVSDGWSTEIFARELSMFYRAFSSGKPAMLPPLPIQYADFAVWQREWLQGDVLQRQIDYWKRRLEGSPPVLNLPAARPRPAIQTFQGARHLFTLPAHLTEELRALSLREEVTLFMTLLAAFQVLLYRYTQQEDLIVGTPIANRTRSEIEDLIGLFVNTLVLRVDLSGNPSFQELLRRVRNVALEAYAHQDLPFEQLVESLQPRRDLSHSPLFQVMFDLQGAAFPLLQLPDLSLYPQALENGTAKFDVTLTLTHSEQGIEGVLQYRRDLFDALTIAQMAQHFQVLLEGIVANPARRIAQLPLLLEEERRQLLEQWCTTQAASPREMCIHQLFAAQVARTPEAVALACEDIQLTYRELNERANQLAHYLRAWGVGPESRVGLCVERSPDVLVSLLGILKAGGAYVPLDPASPAERLVFLLEDARVAVLLTHQRLFEKMRASNSAWTTAAGRSIESGTHGSGRANPGAHGLNLFLPLYRHEETSVNLLIICLDTDWSAVARKSRQSLESDVRADNLAYVIYTSGSTGRPKGVAVTHRNLVHSTNARILYYRDRVERFLLLSSFAFDSSVAGIFWTLCAGGVLLLPPEEFQQDLPQLPDLLARYRISHILSVPSLYGFILADANASQLAWLRQVIVAGEVCPQELVARHQEFLPDTLLFNEYGPTEGTVWSSVYDCRTWETGAKVPIGYAIPNVEIYILDAYLQPVPAGVSGEIYLGGPGLARCYLGRPHTTAECFIPHPFSQEAGARLYKTGDLARYRVDACSPREQGGCVIEYLGRNDEQVKIRGYRIEPGEIAATLLQHPALREAIILARGGNSVPGSEDMVEEPIKNKLVGDSLLVAYIVAADQRQIPTSDELRHFVRERLPDYMVPAAFVALEALPLTATGKVDRRALPSQEAEKQEAFVAPASPVEDLLAGIWAELLGRERISTHSNFFEVGGNSLVATQVLSRVRRIFQIELPLRTLFEKPTILELAEVIEDILTEEIMQLPDDEVESQLLLQ